jgi:dienelactone hydrolase
LRSWKKEARGKLLELLHYAPAKVEPRPETIERVDCGEYIREKIQFNTTPHIRVPAIVLAPKHAPKRAPAIVALHDHGAFYLWGKEKLVQFEQENPALGEFRRQYYGERCIANELVRQGYVVIVIDMFYWGERRMLLDDDAEDWRTRPDNLSRERIQAFNQRAGQNEQLVGRTIYCSGFTWPGVMFWDDVRTVDYLLTRPDVDPARIGCVGLSVGGLRSCHLAALDERIRVAVVVGWMTSFPWQLRNHVNWTIGHTKIVPGLYQHLDYPDVASLAMPTPLLVINGSKDGLFHPEGVKASFEKLHRCYAKAGVPDHCYTRLYDTPHQFNTEMQAEAWAWLKRWI